MNIRIKKEVAGYKPNTIINTENLDVSEKIYWNRRLEDAKIDFCCEVVKEEVKENKSMVQSKSKK